MTLYYYNISFVKIYIILQIGRHDTLLLQYQFCKDLHYTPNPPAMTLNYYNIGFVKIYIILQIRHDTLLLQDRFCKDLYYTSEDAKLRHISLFKEKRKHFRGA